MFFDTPPELLKPIHSLLKNPFKFEAGASIATRLRSHLEHREDFESLLSLGYLFDETKQALAPSLVALRSRMEDELSLIVPTDANLDVVCRSDFQGRVPQVLGMDGARYLSHISVQCQLERLYDHFELRRSGGTNPLTVSECTEAIKLLMLNEALALALAGIATVKRSEQGFNLIIRNSTTKNALRNTWFARTADQFSHVSTLALAKKLADKNANHLRDVVILTERILEQDLSLSWHRIPQEAHTLRSVKKIHAAAGVVALLTVLAFQNRTLKMSGPELNRHGLDFSTVAELIQRQMGALVTDQFITKQGDQLNARIEGASKGLRQLFRSYEMEFGERKAISKHIGGNFYEQRHIRQRIDQGDDYRPRYKTFEGFDRYKVVDNVPNECDIEFIIQDVQQKHYYFVQVKHALLGEKAFLGAIVETIQIQNDIGRGLHQLREAKRLFNDGNLDSTLKARGIVDASPNNSSFILLHNIAQLDFQYSSDGISLYDWATFRNLLKDGECLYGYSDGPVELIRLPTPLISTHPTMVIQRLLTEHSSYKEIHTDPWAQERATTCYEVQGKMIYIHGLGI